MTEPGSGFNSEPLSQLDFETVVPPELADLNASLENLTDAYEVFQDDCAAHATGDLAEGEQHLNVGLQMIIQRMRESWEVIYGTRPDVEIRQAATGIAMTVNAKTIEAYSNILDTDTLELLEREQVEKKVDEALGACTNASDFADTLGAEVGLDLQSDLNQFVHLVKSKCEIIDEIRRVYVGRFAVSAVYDLEDGGVGTFWYHPFRVEDSIAVHDNSFLGSGFEFTFTDDAGTEGRIWYDNPSETTPDETEGEELKKYVTAQILKCLNAFGNPIEIIWTDNEIPDENEDSNLNTYRGDTA